MTSKNLKKKIEIKEILHL